MLLALALRLRGIHNPLLDHPGWRQGDTASIARNFWALQFNIFYPQTNYNGPPPNYVELELQIVPFLAALVYKIAGVHEVFGRLISVAFSLGTVWVLALFGRRLFASASAGLAAALFFAIMPGSIYYGRTFTPDTTMVFFLGAALYAYMRLFVDDETWTLRSVAAPAGLLCLAFLAKPVAAAALIPIAAMAVERVRAGRSVRNWHLVAASVALPCAVLFFYDRFVAAHAEWHWASGITSRHVIPALAASLQSLGAMHDKLTVFHQMLDLLVHTMLGPVLAGLAVAGFIFMPAATRTRALLWGWLAGGLLYTFAVVTVERVDYYMYLLLPLAALSAAGFTARLARAVQRADSGPLRLAAGALALAALALTLAQNTAIAAPYYRYNRTVYRNAVMLDARLEKNALVVMGHYDPSVLYYIGRYGWEEDPYLWTPFDEQSAIRKGARYFIDVERNRFARNLELCAWMQRFPVLDERAQWPVYRTDPHLVKRGAGAAWRSFRNAEAKGQGRAWLEARGECRLKTR